MKIAAGAGYAGDRIEPAVDIIRRAKADYIIFECLAERTIALAQKERQERENGGFNPLLDYRMERIIPLLRENPIKIITNMGAANPQAAAAKVAEIAARHGLPQLKIAAVVGDNVLADVLANPNLPTLENGQPLSNIMSKIISANAYTGASGIHSALADGADIVITGRVADPVLVSAPLMYEFSRKYDDFDFLGKTVAAGHLLECAGQVSGGYFADFDSGGKKTVPNLWDLGFPILDFRENGEMILEKLPNTGGLINARTVKEQILYEVQDPANYYTPDVTADFSQIRIEEIAENQVKITGATGKNPPKNLKVSVGYTDGWHGVAEISYGGRNCIKRAELAAEIIRRRLELYAAPQKIRIDLLGVNSLYKSHKIAENSDFTNLQEIRLRVATHTETAEQAEIIGREVEALYTNGPAGGGVRSSITKVVSVVSCFLPRNTVKQAIHWFGGEK